METDKIKKIVISIVATGVIVGGLVVSFNPDPLMTFEEYETLIKVYNYEIQKAGGKIVLETGGKKDIVQLLNKKLLDTPQNTDVKLDTETLTKEDYKILKSGLFKKTE